MPPRIPEGSSLAGWTVNRRDADGMLRPRHARTQRQGEKRRSGPSGLDEEKSDARVAEVEEKEVKDFQSRDCSIVPLLPFSYPSTVVTNCYTPSRLRPFTSFYSLGYFFLEQANQWYENKNKRQEKGRRCI